MSLRGCFNFRDLGGYETDCGGEPTADQQENRSTVTAMRQVGAVGGLLRSEPLVAAVSCERRWVVDKGVQGDRADQSGSDRPSPRITATIRAITSVLTTTKTTASGNCHVEPRAVAARSEFERA